jgi:hypothetical protein
MKLVLRRCLFALRFGVAFGFVGVDITPAGPSSFTLAAGVFASAADGLAFCVGVTLGLGKSCGRAPGLCCAAGSVSPPDFIHAAQPPSRARAL